LTPPPTTAFRDTTDALVGEFGANTDDIAALGF
jgi:hypothetical protein